MDVHGARCAEVVRAFGRLIVEELMDLPQSVARLVRLHALAVDDSAVGEGRSSLSRQVVCADVEIAIMAVFHDAIKLATEGYFASEALGDALLVSLSRSFVALHHTRAGGIGKWTIWTHTTRMGQPTIKVVDRSRAARDWRMLTHVHGVRLERHHALALASAATEHERLPRQPCLCVLGLLHHVPNCKSCMIEDHDRTWKETTNSHAA